MYTINCDSSLPNNQHEKKFWTLLGVTSNETSTIKGNWINNINSFIIILNNAYTYNCEGQGAGHPDEDELYEAAIVSTNMAYEVVNDELVVLADISETMPKIEILDPTKVCNY